MLSGVPQPLAVWEQMLWMAEFELQAKEREKALKDQQKKRAKGMRSHMGQGLD